MTEEEKEKYLRDFKEKEGIELDVEKIESNPGLRNIAKLMLNSLWGKLAQRPNQPETKIVYTYQELHNIFNDPQYELLGDFPIDEMILLNYRLKDEKNANPRNTSVAIAAFVTAWARLKLYEIIEQIESSRPGSVLYFDTDSVIFCYEEGCAKPIPGPFLGEMTDEIEEEFGTGAKMIEFYSCGPKVYGYKIEKQDGVFIDKFKAKGITQSVKAIENLNFNVIKEKAMNKTMDIENENTKVKQMQFRANKHHQVKTNLMLKDFRVTSDKRRIIGNDTLPYGYVDEDIEYFTEMMTN